MKNHRAGCLRRVGILLAFAWAYHRLVLGTDHFIPDPNARQYLLYLLIGATAWGIASLVADRLHAPHPRRQDHEDTDLD